MNTPAHMALSLAALGGQRRRGDWLCLLIGAILPDAFLFVAHFLPDIGLAELRGATAVLANVFNSLPLYLLALVAGYFAGLRWLVLIAASALLHIAFDLPFHADDAHIHFYPFTDWRLFSPVSFWDADHFGRIVGILEGALFAICFAVIWRRLDTWPQRLLAIGFAAIYLAAFVHFIGHAFASSHWAIW